MTCHWLDEKLERRSYALAVQRILGSHTHDRLAEAINELHKKFLIQNKVRRVVTDNAYNFVKDHLNKEIDR